MRQPIEFRAYNRELKRMEVVGAIDWDYEGNVVTCNTESTKMYRYPPEEILLMQYTGLKDKNGIKIFAGDILAFRDATTGISYPAAVEWDSDCPSYEIGCGIPGCHGMEMLDKDHADNDEIIGNIYENPELLTGGDDV